MSIKPHNNSNENFCKYLNTSKNSALNIFALVRSSENIPINYTENQKDLKKKSLSNETSSTKSIKETLKDIIDFSLFVDPVFMFFAASNFLTSLGFNAPYIYIVDQAINTFGIEADKADWLVSAIGISNMAGRLVLGYVGSLEKISRVCLYSTVLTIGGLVTIIEPLAFFLPGKNLQFFGLLVYSLVFGFSSGKKLYL